jgi:predicted AAA+ superfamily ATPase
MHDITRNFGSVLLSRLQSSHPLLQILIGPRQVGKTTALEQIQRLWTGPSIYITADGVSPPDHGWINLHWQRARMEAEPCLLIIDEVQKVSGWSEAIKILFDQDRRKRDLRVILSGSASLSLQQGMKESLAGRFELTRAFHWSYAEHKTFCGWGLDTYLNFAGYPGPVKFIEDWDRWSAFIRDSILEPVIGRDILGSVTIQKPALLRQLLELVLTHPSQELSYQKMLGQLQESGNATTAKHYLEILEGAFLIKCLGKYSGRTIVQKTSSPKLIPMCPALIAVFAIKNRVYSDSEWRGHVFEAAIGSHLLTGKGQVYYWRDGKFEVDFIVEAPGKLFAIEVKSGRRKSERGLAEFAARYPHCKPVMIDSGNAEDFLTNFPDTWLA